MTLSAPTFTVRASQDQADALKRKLHVELIPVDRERGIVLRFRRTGLRLEAGNIATVTIDVTAEYDENACAQPNSYTVPYHIGPSIKSVNVQLRGAAAQDITASVKSLASLM